MYHTYIQRIEIALLSYKNTHNSIIEKDNNTKIYSQTKNDSDTGYDFWYFFTSGCRTL